MGTLKAFLVLFVQILDNNTSIAFSPTYAADMVAWFRIKCAKTSWLKWNTMYADILPNITVYVKTHSTLNSVFNTTGRLLRTQAGATLSRRCFLVLRFFCLRSFSFSWNNTIHQHYHCPLLTYAYCHLLLYYYYYIYYYLSRIIITSTSLFIRVSIIFLRATTNRPPILTASFSLPLSITDAKTVGE